MNVDRTFCRAARAAVLCAALTLLGACATTAEQSATTRAASEPRPIGVAEDATPEERGREILRVIVALIRHGDLRDTEFASRLLRLPIKRDKGLGLWGSEKFHQELVRLFGYNIPSNISTHHVNFGLDPARTCVLREDLLITMKREFGVGTDILPDSVLLPGTIRREPSKVTPEQGWYRATLETHQSPGDLRIYQLMGSGMSVEASGSTYHTCIPSVVVRQFRTKD